MPYCTLAQLIDRFGEPTLIAATDRGALATGVVDSAAVERAIADADAYIDGFLSARYAMPLASVPSQVNELSLTVSIYKLHPNVAGEKITADYKDAQKLLGQISSGIFRLSIAGIEPATSGNSDVRTNEPDRTFTAQTLRGYI
jgi:phage gp36-like protein